MLTKRAGIAPTFDYRQAVQNYRFIPESGVRLQQKINATAFHPTGKHIKIPVEELNQSVVERFEDQVRQSGTQVAVRTHQQDLRYEELNNIANCIAYAVRERTSYGPVVVLVELGTMAVAAILGVLKAGVAYVHIDPMLPQASSAARLVELGSTLVLSDIASLELRASAGPLRRPVLQLESIDFKVMRPNPGLSTDPASVAQILYTSGSTGSPKAVCNTHRSVLMSLRDVTNNLHICSDDRLLLLATGTGQASSVIFSALLNGATLLPFNVRKEGITQLVSWILSERVTIYRSSATLFRQVAKALTGKEGFPDVRLVRLASETVHKSDVELWKCYFSDDCILVNGLSTAETGPIVEFFMNKEITLESETVPIGYAVGCAEPIVVDEEGHEVPRGETGEIAVKSSFLAMSYLNRSELTADVFKTIDERKNLRLYMTRDIGRMSEDGCVEHLGRKDFRVKIRGYSVQLADVEEVLMALDEVQSAVVITVTRGEYTRLVAYVSPAPGARPTASSLRRSLLFSLPEFMLPAAFVFMRDLPVGSSGKVDRMALPDPGAIRPPLDACYAPAKNSTQAALIELWVEILGIDKIGISDPFLELGGDSLLAMQLAMRIDQHFNIKVPQWKLYECATPSEMSVLINQYTLQAAADGNIGELLARIDDLSDAQARELLAVIDAQSSGDS